LDATVGRPVDSIGVPDGELLLAFADAAVRDEPTLAEIREQLVAAIGPAATGQAVATVAAFSGLVRVADGTGIPVDDGMAAASADLRDRLGLGCYNGAANSEIAAIPAAPFTTVDALWGGVDTPDTDGATKTR
jgi:hypothetical protein